MERIKWAEIGPEFLTIWGRPDNNRIEPEHVAILGPNGSGKSVFATYICKERARLRGSHVVIIATKPADATMTKMGWPIVREWPPPYGKHEQLIFWPKTSRDESENLYLQKQQIKKCLNDLWMPNANTIVMFDEIAYVEDELKLRTLIIRYWREGRSLGITVIGTTQRPVYVSRYMWTESKWLAAFKPEDQEEAMRVAQILGNRKKYTEILESLKPHEFIFRHRRTGSEYITKLGT